jgi:hypothetical protein
MTVKNHTVGSPSGPYWEHTVQNGADTPYLMRKMGLWPINPYTSMREGQMQNWSSMVYGDGSLVAGGAGYGLKSFIQVSHSAAQWPAETDVLSKLHEKWKNSDINLGMYLSPEGRESVQMMTAGLMKISNGARSLKRGDFGGFLRNLNELPRSARKRSARAFEQGDLSGSFLAAHLGWEPLIKDIYAASDIDPPYEGPVRIRASRKRAYYQDVVPLGNTQVPHSLKVYANKSQVTIIVDIKRPPTFSQRFGMENPFLIAWELVPLSFVADYFLPIGSIIDNMGFISGIWGSKGLRKEYAEFGYRAEIRRMTLLHSSYGWYNKEGWFDQQWTKSFNRALWSPSFSDPFRNVNVTLPSSLMKLSTLASLTHQRLLSLNRR